MTTIHIQSSFALYSTEDEVARYNAIASDIHAVASELGATDAFVQKVKCGKRGDRYARVQFQANGKYLGNIQI